MPTRTFYNLPEDKREKLMDAIRSELSRTPVDEISINKIIHAAEIPRGSFYQYFENKGDMLRYLLSEYRILLFDHAHDSLQNNGGDLFLTLIDIFDFTYSFVMKDHVFFKNIFSDIRIDVGFYERAAEESIFHGFTESVAPYVNKALLNICGEADFANMCDMLLLITGEAFASTFFDTSLHNNMRNKYVAKLEILKRGFKRDSKRDLKCVFGTAKK